MSLRPKWIKISTGIFDEDDRIKRIEKRTDRDSIMMIWFKLNIQAGRCNAGGILQFTDVVPLDIESLADLFDRPEEQVKSAIDLFMEWGMLEQDEDGFYYLPNWQDDQNEEALAKIRENARNRVNKYRQKLKEGRGTASGASPASPNPPAPARTKVPKVLPPYDEIIAYLNQVAERKFTVTDKVKGWINGRFEEDFTLADFKEVIDKKTREWKRTEQEKYLRPQTLFIPDNFQAYLNQPWPEERKGKPANETANNNGDSANNWNFVE